MSKKLQMDQATYDRFKELRQSYYIAGRCLLINQLFGMAGINLGYCIELSLKFVLAFHGHPKSELMKHDVDRYYQKVISHGYIPALEISSDFLRFITERLNSRYPTMITKQLAQHQAESRAYVFPIDMLHCYDDFILQLDDAISEAAQDPRISIGFRSCRELLHIRGRIFFHCNDHAFARISHYKTLLVSNRNEGDDFDRIDMILSHPEELWNFKGLMAYRPWGPKTNWKPAAEYASPKVEDGRIQAKAAKWHANNADAQIYLSSLEIILPPGTYQSQLDEVVVPRQGKQE